MWGYRTMKRIAAGDWMVGIRCAGAHGCGHLIGPRFGFDAPRVRVCPKCGVDRAQWDETIMRLVKYESGSWLLPSYHLKWEVKEPSK